MADSFRPKNWPYRADIPQRYNDNAALYYARGGKVRLEEDVKAYVADGNLGDISRFYSFCLMQDQIAKEGLEGDVAELGVYRGNTASLLATIARRKNATAWLFDTFEGFRAEDLTGIDADKKLEQFRDTSLEAVRERVGDECVRYVSGYFPQSTIGLPPNLRFCLVHIDCDLYEPILAALDYFYPRLVPGGFLVMHDYTSLAWNGAERAIDEFFVDKPESVVPMPDGAGTAVVRKARDIKVDRHWSCPRPLPQGEWVQAGAGGLLPWLRDGWSGPEPWGVWGVGERHSLVVPRTDKEAIVEFACATALSGTVTTRAIEVSVDGDVHAVWIFTAEINREIRQVRVSPGLNDAIITFSPAELLRPDQIHDGLKEDRMLGLALHGVRYNS